MRGRAVTRTSVRVFLTFFSFILCAHLGSLVEYVEAGPVGQATVPLMERGEKGKFAQWVGNVRQPLEQQIQDKRNGIGRQRRPYVGESNKVPRWLRVFLAADRRARHTVYALTLAMLGVLIYELVYNAKEQGNPFSFKVRPFLRAVYSVRVC